MKKMVGLVAVLSLVVATFAFVGCSNSSTPGLALAGRSLTVAASFFALARNSDPAFNNALTQVSLAPLLQNQFPPVLTVTYGEDVKQRVVIAQLRQENVDAKGAVAFRFKVPENIISAGQFSVALENDKGPILSRFFVGSSDDLNFKVDPLTTAKASVFEKAKALGAPELVSNGSFIGFNDFDTKLALPTFTTRAFAPRAANAVPFNTLVDQVTSVVVAGMATGTAYYRDGYDLKGTVDAKVFTPYVNTEASSSTYLDHDAYVTTGSAVSAVSSGLSVCTSCSLR